MTGQVRKNQVYGLDRDLVEYAGIVSINGGLDLAEGAGGFAPFREADQVAGTRTQQVKDDHFFAAIWRILGQSFQGHGEHDDEPRTLEAGVQLRGGQAAYHFGDPHMNLVSGLISIGKPHDTPSPRRQSAQLFAKDLTIACQQDAIISTRTEAVKRQHGFAVRSAIRPFELNDQQTLTLEGGVLDR